jgi:hypothetical protein
MTHESQNERAESQDESPANEVLEEPSTEKEPAEEPKGGSAQDTADHRAVGIGVISTSVPDDEQKDSAN